MARDRRHPRTAPQSEDAHRHLESQRADDRLAPHCSKQNPTFRCLYESFYGYSGALYTGECPPC